jgi:hypothetical protein
MKGGRAGMPEKMNPTVKEVVRSFLEDNGYDGLFNSEFDCGCDLEELMPCEDYFSDCECGYKHPNPEITESDFLIMRNKREWRGRTMKKLRMCPFCGGEATSLKIVSPCDESPTSVLLYKVACMNEACQINPETEVQETEEKAITAWNTRLERKGPMVMGRQ